MENNQNIIIKNIYYELILIDINLDFSFDKYMNWIKNRPADEIRINEIYNYYINNNVDLIPGTVSVWKPYNNYHIYDGLHRFLAAKKLILENKRINIQMLLYINLSKNEDDIIEEFKSINKSIPLPFIYTETENLIKKQVCQDTVNLLYKRYPDFCSTSRKPHKFNFNRDLLIDFIYTFNINFNINNLDNTIFNIFLNLNKMASEEIQTNNIKCPAKCIKYEFYLFYFSKEYIKREVEKIIN